MKTIYRSSTPLTDPLKTAKTGAGRSIPLNKLSIEVFAKPEDMDFQSFGSAIWYIATMGDKSVETLGSKIEFLSILVTFPPFPPKQC